nr:hypothetical protein [Tanacetum cinerariifolium]
MTLTNSYCLTSVVVQSSQQWHCFSSAVGTFFTGSGNFFWKWELHNWQWECLVHFIPNMTYQELLSGLYRYSHHLHLLQRVHLQQGTKAPSLSKSAASAPQYMAWTTSDTRYESVGLSGTQELSPTDSLIPNDSILDEQTGDMINFLKWYCRQVNKTVLTPADLEGQAYEVVKAFYPYVIHLQFQMEECHKMLTYQVDWTNPERDQMKAASYHEFGLELLVPELMWIDDVHTSPSRRRKVRSTMRILSVVRIEAYSIYGYDYLIEIVLRRADFQEHTISEKDFKNPHPSDFVDLICSFFMFPVNNNERKIMWFNEIYKFSDGMLTRILEVLAYRVKEFKINGSIWRTVPKDRPCTYAIEVIRMVRLVGSNPLVHSFRALSALRRSGVRMASTAAKPCQGDSSKVYLITGIIYTDQQGTVVLATLFNESEQRHLRLIITNVYLQESRWLQLLARNASIHNPMLTLHISIQRHHDG